MRFNLFILAILLFGFGGNAIAQDVVLRNGNVVNTDNGEVLTGYDVVVKDGTIVSIKKSKGKIKKGDVDVTGKYLLPGLIDSHVHWASYGPTDEMMANQSKEALREGVTTVRDVGGDSRRIKKYLAGREAGLIQGPNVHYAAFWVGEIHGSIHEDTRGYHTKNAPWCRKITGDSDSIAMAVREAKDFGCMGLKIYKDYDAKAVASIVDECKKQGVKPWAHFSTVPANAMEVVKAGVETVSHIYLIDCEDSWRIENFKEIIFTPARIAERKVIFDEMVRRGTILDATLTISLESGMEYVIEYMKEAYRAGVKFVTGTDYAFPGKDDVSSKSAFLHEVELFVDRCGVKPLDVLRAATVMGAEMLGLRGHIGELKSGARADIIVLESNPLCDIRALRSIDMLYIDGKVMDISSK